ncbi:MAG: hypothetical protein O3B70_01975 [Bacteroidetes bacterium]|nr:hypothetical protein [Bacteroidota bacterium]MDA0903078.1 hypothetical protein [Bacteroidota bacterium]MDA1241712.1 hypothetical protein [Bacteroidota bacterium]
MLPMPMRQAWGGHPELLIQWATSADSRKHTDSLEAPRHYLDVDDLPVSLADGLPIVWGLPHDLADSLTSTSKDGGLGSFGLLPWHIERVYNQLTWSMKSDSVDLNRVLRLAADLGHYLGDAHVPLHTSGNYDGQRTGQRGIHALWETHAMEWLLAPSRASSCPCTPLPSFDPRWTAWEILDESHAMVPMVLHAETELRRLHPEDGWGFRRRGRTLQLLPTPEALATWDSLTNHTTFPRFCKASHRIAAAWYAAWMDAGAPNLASPAGPTNHGFWAYLAEVVRALRLKFKVFNLRLKATSNLELQPYDDDTPETDFEHLHP